MASSFDPNIPNLIVMIKPKSFGFNQETANSNSFQQNIELEDVNIKANAEFDEMVKQIKTHEIELHVFDDLKVGLPDSVFPNNWISNIPNQVVVIYPMLAKNRQREVRQDVIEWVSDELGLSKVIDLRDHQGILEGTGSIVFDHSNKMAFAAVSPRTTVKLLNELCKKIGYESCTFESTDLKGEQIYHTNVMMSVADKYAVVCLESIPDHIERLMLKNKLKSLNKEVVEITNSQMNRFAGNVLEVKSKSNQSYLLLSVTAKSALSSDQIAQIEVYSKLLDFSIPTIEKIGGGSVRCMLAGMFKD